MLALKWFGRPKERRAGPRVVDSALTAAYWNGAAPAPRMVRNIGPNGAFIEAVEPWRAGTMIHMALEPTPDGQNGGEKTLIPAFGLWARIVRFAPDGMAVQFVFENRAERRKFLNFLATLNIDGKAMTGGTARTGAENGRRLVENSECPPGLES